MKILRDGIVPFSFLLLINYYMGLCSLQIMFSLSGQQDLHIIFNRFNVGIFPI